MGLLEYMDSSSLLYKELKTENKYECESISIQSRFAIKADLVHYSTVNQGRNLIKSQRLPPGTLE